MFCNKTCSIQYAMRTEVMNEKAIKDVINDKVEAVESAMNVLEECVKEKTRRHMTALEDLTRYVDSGFNNPETIDWCRLIYIPVPRMLKRRNVSAKVKEWVHLSELEVALDEQKARIKQTEIKRCPLQRCASTFINEWDHR